MTIIDWNNILYSDPYLIELPPVLKGQICSIKYKASVKVFVGNCSNVTWLKEGSEGEFSIIDGEWVWVYKTYLRELAFYRVKLNEEWTVGRWTTDGTDCFFWNVCGIETSFNDEDLEEIGAKIEI